MNVGGGNTSEGKASIEDYALLRSVVLSEKSSSMGLGGGHVTFKVPRTVSKEEIRGAIERVFNVKVAAVRTLNQMGKTRRTARGVGRRPSFKKAYVTLQDGYKISLADGV